MSDSVTLENKDFQCSKLSFTYLGTDMELEGQYGHNNFRLYIHMSDVSDEDNKCNLDFNLVIVDLSMGLHYFTTHQFCPDTHSRKPYYAFYDLDALTTLKNNFKLQDDIILKLTQKELTRWGFKPVKSFFMEINELMADSNYNFTKSLLKEIQYSDFAERINGVNRTNKHI